MKKSLVVVIPLIILLSNSPSQLLAADETVAKPLNDVGIGRAIVLKRPNDIKMAVSANSEVCSVTVSPDTRSVIVSGVRAGTTTIVLLYDPASGEPETIPISVGRVESECKGIVDVVKQQFPKSNVTLTSILGSSKVILKGSMASAYEHQRVRELIEAIIPRADIVDMSTWACPCCCTR